MKNFEDRIFLSLDGDEIVASFQENKLKVSIPGLIMDVELQGVQIDDWYEKGNIRIKLEEDVLHISQDTKGFPLNTVKYIRIN